MKTITFLALKALMENHQQLSLGVTAGNILKIIPGLKRIIQVQLYVVLLIGSRLKKLKLEFFSSYQGDTLHSIMTGITKD
jgi:hypothetical protein